jgi:tetratricopeptide (TPR) repeat protein
MFQPPKRLLQDFLGGKGLVMVVEPSSNYRTSIKQFLTNLKIKHMKLVSSVAEARREMLTTRVSFFIVEWGLDETNGLQFCRSLRKEAAYKDTPFLLLSTENLRQDVILASEVKVDGYLLKPFSYEDFCSQVNMILRSHTTPSRVTTLLDTADAKLAAGNLEAAESGYAEALATSKEKSARAFCGLARVQRQRDDAKGALNFLHQATLVNPEYVEAYRVKLEICEEQGDRTGIIQAASVLNSLSPENPRYTLVLARTYLEMAQFEGSETFFKRTLTLSPRLAEAYKGLGNIYLAKEEYEKAMKSFRKALDLDKDDISTLNSLGMTYVRMGQYKEGIDKYMIALRLDPHDFRVLFNIGHAHEKRGDLEKAKWYYGQSVVHKSGYERARRGLERLDKIKGEGPAADFEIEDVSDEDGGGGKKVG